MVERMTVVTVMVVLLMGLPAGAARAAGAGDAAWDQAAGDVAFTVWRPAQTGRFIGAVGSSPCQSATHASSVAAGYHPRRSKWVAGLNLTESSARRCLGWEPPTQVYKTVRIRGSDLQVRIACPRGRRCRVPRSGPATVWWMDLRKPGAAGGRPTYIRVNAFGITVKAMLRVVGSLARVDLTRSTIHVRSFVTSDNHIWCTLSKPQATCVSAGPMDALPQYAGEVRAGGAVTLCQAITDDDTICTQNWSVGDPVLRAGQTDMLGGFQCAAAATSITCTVTAGGGGGRGFTISNSGVAEVPTGAARVSAA